MGALPLPDPKRVPAPAIRKAPAKAASAARKCAPRTREEIDQAFRAGSSYDQGTGWGPLYRVEVSDSINLRRGAIFTDLRDYITSQVNRDREKGQGAAALSREVLVSIADTAVFLTTTPRSINRELAYMERRELAIVKRMQGGKALVRIVFAPETIGGHQFPGWSEAAKMSFADWKKANPDFEKKWADPSAVEESPDDEPAGDIPVKKGTVALTSSPQVVRGGHRSRSIPVNTGVRKLRIHWENKTLDLQFSAVVTSGELILTGDIPEAQPAESTKRAKPVESKSSGDQPGHTCPDNRKIPLNAGSHPRGDEIAKLFDPLIYRHCARTITAEPAILLKSCIAIGETPHDFVVKAAIDRSERRLEPHHIPALCKQIEQDWRAGKGLSVLRPMESPVSKNGKHRQTKSEMIAEALKDLDE